MKKNFFYDLIKLSSFVMGTIWFFFGCKQATKWPESNKPETQKPVIVEKTVSEQYNDYLLLMNEKERSEFFKLDSDFRREQFLQAQGIQQKKYLHDHLYVGMPLEKVEALKELGTPSKTEVNMSPGMVETYWIYETFNGYSNLTYVIAFQNNKVTEWRVWIP